MTGNTSLSLRKQKFITKVLCL